MEVGAHERVSRVLPEAAYTAAFLALIDSLACAFMALQDPACAKLLGAVVPGATMAFGARVPGTSFQLDPVQAAFNIGTMVGWLDANDRALATVSGHLSDNLGAILAVADYRARKAIAEGTRPPTIRDLFAALISAHDHASLEWARLARANEPASTLPATDAIASLSARCALVRIASAAAAASQLGGTRDQVAAAIALAHCEARAIEHLGAAQSGDTHDRWRVGDATSRGVRLALIALAGQTAPRPALPQSGAEVGLHRAASAEPGQTWWTVAGAADVDSRIRDRFGASVTAHFPAAQAGKIATLFAGRAKLEALPVNELVSMTVRN